MRYAIFSDIHSNLEGFNAVLGAFSKESIDSYLCAGDIVGYGADPEKCIERFKKLSGVSVLGNHDAAVVGLRELEHFNPAAGESVLWTQNVLGAENKSFLSSLEYIYENEDLVLVHGSLDTPEQFSYLLDKFLSIRTFELMKAPVCFVGHSHIPAVFIQDEAGISISDKLKVNVLSGKKYIVNVGSVGQPRDHNPEAAYCIYDTDSGLIEIKRIEYNIKKAQDKIIQAGLPVFLSNRLSEGK